MPLSQVIAGVYGHLFLQLAKAATKRVDEALRGVSET